MEWIRWREFLVTTSGSTRENHRFSHSTVRRRTSVLVVTSYKVEPWIQWEMVCPTIHLSMHGFVFVFEWPKLSKGGKQAKESKSETARQVVITMQVRFLVAKSNSITGFVRPSVGRSVGPWVGSSVTRFSKTANSSKFNKIQQNSRHFATVGLITNGSS